MQDDKHVILVVDDDPDIAESLRLVLMTHGYRVVTAGSAEVGLRQVQEHRPDLVIVDLMMEEVDSGTSFVKELRLLGNTAPVFLLSSVGDALYRSTDYAALGFAGVFQKPIDPATLIATVRDKMK